MVLMFMLWKNKLSLSVSSVDTWRQNKTIFWWLRSERGNDAVHIYVPVYKW